MVKNLKRSPRCPAAPGPHTRRLRAPLLRKRPWARAFPRFPRALADRDPERAGVDFLARDSRPGNRRLRCKHSARDLGRGRSDPSNEEPFGVPSSSPSSRRAVSLPSACAVRGKRPSRSFRAIISAPRVCGGRSPRFVKQQREWRSLGVQGGRGNSNKEKEERLVPEHYNREEANTHKAKEKKKQKAKQLFAESST